MKNDVVGRARDKSFGRGTCRICIYQPTDGGGGLWSNLGCPILTRVELIILVVKKTDWQSSTCRPGGGQDFRFLSGMISYPGETIQAGPPCGLGGIDNPRPRKLPAMPPSPPNCSSDSPLVQICSLSVILLQGGVRIRPGTEEEILPAHLFAPLSIGVGSQRVGGIRYLGFALALRDTMTTSYYILACRRMSSAFQGIDRNRHSLLQNNILPP